MKAVKMALVLGLAATMLAAFVVPMSSANAATVSHTVTITQDEINSSYSVVSPRSRKVSDVKVTVDNGDISIAATITLRKQQPIVTVSVWKPVIAAGIVYWKLDSATVGGQAATKQQIALLNIIHRYTLRNLIWRLIRHDITRGSYRVDNVALTPGTVTITATTYMRSKTVKMAATPAATKAAQ